MHPLIQLKQKTSLFLIALLLACFGLLPRAQAVVPAPDGGYPGGNTAEGQAALLSLTTGGFNTAVGFFSLRSERAGSFNTAIGAGALLANTGDVEIGEHNTATGAGALLSNTIGNNNTANGASALFNNTTGNLNAAIGYGALHNNTTGSGNVAFGNGAGGNVSTASNVICIGTSGQNLSGSTWISNIFGITTQSGVTMPVLVSNEGQLGTASSSRRFKKNIQPMNEASESILALKPVRFHYRSDQSNTAQFGLIAEESPRWPRI
jgi:trimeric autotransporter adhesin